MILIDTSVWIDHLRQSDPALTDLLTQNQVLVHPFVIGELALGNARQTDNLIRLLSVLPQPVVANDQEVMHLIRCEALAGIGIGFIDVHLLASTRLTPGATLWTRDKRLAKVAHKLGIGYERLQ